MKRVLRNLSFGVSIVLIALVFTNCKKNVAPVVSAVTVNPPTIQAGGSVSVTVTAVDADNDPLTYTYQVNGGAITGAGAAVNWTVPSAAGAYSVTVTVSDGNGGQAIGTGAVTVTEVQTETKVTGTCSFLAGMAGDLSNCKVSIYTSLANWNANSPIVFGKTVGSGASVNFDMNNVLPGNYYLDVWKDNDVSGTWSRGDFVGWYGSGGLGSPLLTEFQLTEGQTFTVAIDMWVF